MTYASLVGLLPPSKLVLEGVYFPLTGIVKV
nr:MAG TPA: hypothetical protein [Caudoviricetes sp.]